MTRFILRRVFQLLPLVIGITFLSFAIMKLAPGDYLSQMQGNPSVSPETIIRLRHQYGLDKPWLVQYWLWLVNACHGNFGYSFEYKANVFDMIKPFVGATILLSVTSSFISYGIALPAGIYAATHRGGVVDRISTVVAAAGVSIPAFFAAILALLFAHVTGWFPVGGMTSNDHDTMSTLGKFWDVARHLILPAFVLGIRGVSVVLRQMRGNLLEVLSENYIMAARARGLSERMVIWKHGVRNAINPLVTLFGSDLGALLAGAALVEKVMAWPGLGRLLLQAVQSKDLYLAMASFVMGAVMLILGNLVADILLAITDPRIKYS